MAGLELRPIRGHAEDLLVLDPGSNGFRFRLRPALRMEWQKDWRRQKGFPNRMMNMRWRSKLDFRNRNRGFCPAQVDARRARWMPELHMSVFTSGVTEGSGACQFWYTNPHGGFTGFLVNVSTYVSRGECYPPHFGTLCRELGYAMIGGITNLFIILPKNREVLYQINRECCLFDCTPSQRVTWNRGHPLSACVRTEGEGGLCPNAYVIREVVWI